MTVVLQGKMKFRFCVFLSSVLTFVGDGSCWEVLSNIGARRHVKGGYVFKNEYTFGDCKRRDTVMYETVHLTFHEIQFTEIFRDWLWYTYRIPTCIILRASSYETETYRVTKDNFQICVPRVSFCYNNHRNNYYYYELYIPQSLTGGSDWDIYFYGPDSKDWTYMT